MMRQQWLTEAIGDDPRTLWIGRDRKVAILQTPFQLIYSSHCKYMRSFKLCQPLLHQYLFAFSPTVWRQKPFTWEGKERIFEK